ncbi:uncharacterized protein PHACADRAFT_264720 [Phanerochaete carnosa HHB-10118-sp]|uniref:Nephrocystin 3-like N-terminal domain-containing protein n=1 Tax=Phanerochaete carnosa (strain HHB-10118-sp) TaxID=650164 RepID=K5WIS8_PHACS|nr:uncharacterized protein PHACADRAFT_264720 [Phanerochaete carnosa HHB-10118-sp]EKM50152.1 hypothetical protein PHACADRAFT_264720 [Phanerochaete carnosa HHB-10118-sp]
MQASQAHRGEPINRLSDSGIRHGTNAAMPASQSRRAELIDVALDNAKPFFELAENILELAPVPGLPYIAKGLVAVVDRVRDARTNDDTFRAFNEEVMALDAVIREILTKTQTAVKDYDGDTFDKEKLLDGIVRSEGLQVRTQALLNSIGELRESSGDLKSGSGFRGFLKGVIYASRNEATLSKMRDAMAKAVAMFKLRGQVSIEMVLNDAVNEAKMLRKAFREEEERRVVDSIFHAPAGYRSVDQLKSEFMDGTREELFEELDQWADGSFPEYDPKPVYFLGGAAGVGKSSITHQLCKRLDGAARRQSCLGASFFFVRGRQGLDSTRAFFSTLAHQLAQSQPALRPHIIAAAREYLKQGDRQQMQYAFEGLLRKPLTNTTTIGQKPVILVIDGLDECRERDLLPDLLRFMLDLVRLVTWLRLFVASRLEPHIVAILRSAEFHSIVHCRSLDDTLEEWNDDVKRYLEFTIPKIPPYDTFVRDNPDILERLIQRAAGVFIYARIVVTFLDTYRDRPEEQFELLLASGGAGLTPLDALYLQILQSAFPPDDLRANGRRQERLHSFLTFIALQLQPIASGAIALLGLGLSENDVVAMVDRLRSILLIDHSGCVVPLHATFGEFLLDDKRCSDPLYHIGRSKGHARLASGCLTVLTSPRTLSGYWETGPGSHLRSCVYYARRGWDEHLQNAEFSDGLAEQVQALIQATPAYMGVYSSTFFQIGVPASIARFLKPHMDIAKANEICVEYAKFVTYSRKWWTQKRMDPNAVPTISLDDIHEATELWIESEVDLNVQSGDVARYQAAHETFAGEIANAGLAELWYKGSE